VSMSKSCKQLSYVPEKYPPYPPYPPNQIKRANENSDLEELGRPGSTNLLPPSSSLSSQAARIRTNDAAEPMLERPGLEPSREQKPLDG
jgi:hypothetical protein